MYTEFEEKTLTNKPNNGKIIDETDSKRKDALNIIKDSINKAYEGLIKLPMTAFGSIKSKDNTLSVQNDLNKHGYTDLQGNSLKTDGIWGDKTNGAFNKAIFHEQQIKNPDSNTKDLQTVLNKYGYTDINGNKLKEDGVLGPLTDSAAYNAVRDLSKTSDNSTDKITHAFSKQPINSDNKKTDTEITKSLLKQLPESDIEKIKNNLDLTDDKSETGLAEAFNSFSEKYDLNYDDTVSMLSKDSLNDEYKFDMVDAENSASELIFDEKEYTGTPKAGTVSKKDEITKQFQKIFDACKWAFNTVGGTVTKAQKTAQRIVWKAGADLYLRKLMGFHTSAWVLEHSLQDNPDDITRGNDSRIAYLINTDEAYLTALDEKIKNSKNGRIEGELKDIEFKKRDLYYSIHKATINVDGYKQKNGKWIIHSTLSDTYDFTEILTFMGENGKLSLEASLGTVANDAATISQFFDVINPYKVTVDFYTTR